MILHVLIAMIAGWINRHQQHVITYLQEENRVLTSKLPHGRLRLTDTERRRLAAMAYPLSRKQLKGTATIATPDTLMRWYNRLIADKFDGSRKRKGLGRPRVPEEVEQLVMRLAEENPTSPDPSAPCESAGHEHSKRVCKTSSTPVGLIAGTPEPLHAMIIHRPRCLHTLWLRLRWHTEKQHVSQIPDTIGQSGRHRWRTRPPQLGRATAVGPHRLGSRLA